MGGTSTSPSARNKTNPLYEAIHYASVRSIYISRASGFLGRVDHIYSWELPDVVEARRLTNELAEAEISLRTYCCIANSTFCGHRPS